MSHASGFKTSEGEAAFMAAYDTGMKLWPVSYEEMTIQSRFGTTHVVYGDIDDVVAQHRGLQQGIPGLRDRCHGTTEQEHSR
jgi:hypothetical protein